jgi:hypothetical protein
MAQQTSFEKIESHGLDRKKKERTKDKRKERRE